MSACMTFVLKISENEHLLYSLCLAYFVDLYYSIRNHKTTVPHNKGFPDFEVTACAIVLTSL